MDNLDQYWSLHDINLHRILCPHRLKEYKNRKKVSLKKGDIIYSDQQQDFNFYLIAKGNVKLVSYSNDGEEQLKLKLKKGEVFGEKIVLGESKKREFAIAETTTTEICPVSNEALKDLMRKNKKFELYIYKLVGLRLKRIERRLEILFNKDAKQRLIELIDDLIKDYQGEAELPNSFEFDIIYSQSELAKLIGTSREYVSKILSELSRNNILNYTRKKIQISDLEAFQALKK